MLYTWIITLYNTVSACAALSMDATDVCCPSTLLWSLASYVQGKARTGFFKQVKKAYPMFPLFEDRIKWDEYGEIIR